MNITFYYNKNEMQIIFLGICICIHIGWAIKKEEKTYIEHSYYL